MKLLYIGLAGMVGTLARYWLAGYSNRLLGAGFPWGTAVVNLTGCFLFGLIWALADERFLIGGELRIILLIGFMGAFTTFSSLEYETFALLRDGQWLLGFANVALHNTVGLLCLWGGIVVGKAV